MRMEDLVSRRQEIGIARKPPLAIRPDRWTGSLPCGVAVMSMRFRTNAQLPRICSSRIWFLPSIRVSPMPFEVAAKVSLPKWLLPRDHEGRLRGHLFCSPLSRSQRLLGSPFRHRSLPNPPVSFLLPVARPFMWHPHECEVCRTLGEAMMSSTTRSSHAEPERSRGRSITIKVSLPPPES